MKSKSVIRFIHVEVEGDEAAIEQGCDMVMKSLNALFPDDQQTPPAPEPPLPGNGEEASKP